MEVVAYNPSPDQLVYSQAVAQAHSPAARADNLADIDWAAADNRADLEDKPSPEDMSVADRMVEAARRVVAQLARHPEVAAAGRFDSNNLIAVVAPEERCAELAEPSVRLVGQQRPDEQLLSAHHQQM